MHRHTGVEKLAHQRLHPINPGVILLHHGLEGIGIEASSIAKKLGKKRGFVDRASFEFFPSGRMFLLEKLFESERKKGGNMVMERIEDQGPHDIEKQGGNAFHGALRVPTQIP